MNSFETSNDQNEFDVIRYDFAQKLELERNRMKSIFLFVISLIFLALAFIITTVGDDDFAKQVSYASTVSSIILSVIAILMSISGEKKTESMRGQLVDSVSRLEKTTRNVEEINKVHNREIVESIEKIQQIQNGLLPIEESIKAMNDCVAETLVIKKANIKLDKDRGIIFNQSDNSRNVSFKVETINKLLEVVYTKQENKEAANKVLYSMGYESGKQFGKAMKKDFELKSDLSLEDRITKWCDFDSEVGWGKLQCNLYIDKSKRDVSMGHLTLKDNFLIYDRSTDDIKLCQFIIGYYDGILTELSDKKNIAVCCHDPEKCCQGNTGNRRCIFDIKEVKR